MTQQSQHSQNSIPISPTVELQEMAALVSHYRNRSLIQAQAIAEATAEIAALKAEIEALKSPPADTKEGAD